MTVFRRNQIIHSLPFTRDERHAARPRLGEHAAKTLEYGRQHEKIKRAIKVRKLFMGDFGEEVEGESEVKV